MKVQAPSVLARAALVAVQAIGMTALMAAASVAFGAEAQFAAPKTAEPVTAASAGSLAQVTLSLLLVLAAVFAAAWVMRKLRNFGKFGAGAIEILADVAVGTKERAVLVQVGKQQLLLGVAPGRVNTLHVLSEPVSRPVRPLPNPPPFHGGGSENESGEGVGGDAQSSSSPPPFHGGGQGGGAAGGTPRPDFKAILKRSLGL
jgi:flagellar protein FliO/FliZ